MDARLVANYLTSLKEKNGLTYEAIALKCGMSETTIRNLLTGKTEDPRLNTVAPITYALNGSVDEMYSGKSKEKLQEISLNSIKEMYEFQLSEQRKTEEIRFTNIRSDHEKHVADLKESHEKQDALKDKLYEEKCKENRLFKILAGVGYAILIGLLILEVANPSLGWIRF